MLHAGRVEGRAPAPFVVARELEVVALSRHADRDPADAGPGVEPGPERPQGAVVGRAREPGESERGSQELAALIHALLDDLVRPQQHCLGDSEAEGLRHFEIDDKLKLGGLFHG